MNQADKIKKWTKQGDTIGGLARDEVYPYDCSPYQPNEVWATDRAKQLYDSYDPSVTKKGYDTLDYSLGYLAYKKKNQTRAL